MNLMRVTVYLGENGAGRSSTYAIAASSPREAAILMSDHLGLRYRWERIDVELLFGERVAGPPRVLGPVGGEVKARS
ncbi:MAG TPA: hypothetical protein VM713_10415 [Steroidobacteraceae bacterium]|nr:hypothetical protein [Steroidobacteraceae bacterium]